jgi:SWI/SNF-related matrix-associated actin-dependent regulator of chromatin subfamily A-like protein 1
MPQLTHDGFRFTLTISSGEKETAKALGFHFDLKKLVWWTSLPVVAKSFEQYADEKAKYQLHIEENQIALSRATESNFNVPVPAGLQLYPFQKVPVEYALSRKNTLIADEMGAGKTLEAIGIINSAPEIKKILVVCPATLRLNWASELMKWSTKKLTGGFIYEKVFPEDADIMISSYDMIKKVRYKIDSMSKKFDLIIYDESHLLKSFSAARTRACLGGILYDKKTFEPIDCGMRVFMTGTPILNRVLELWPMLSVADPDGLGISEWNFIERYTKPWDSPWGTTEYAANKDMLDELQNRLRAKLMVRRLKKDILSQLPPKRRQIIALPAEAVKKAVQAELEFYNKNQELIESAIQRAEQTQAGDDLSYKEAAADLKRGRAAMFQEMSILRHATGVAKIPYIIEYLEQALEQQDKVVCFCHHLDIIEAIGKHFGNIAVVHHGRLTDPQKVKARERFQGSNEKAPDPKCRLFVGGITISVGFNLTVASLAVMSELDWRPSIVSQAEDRLHRIGQNNGVLIQHLVFDQSLDSNMVKKIIQKQELIENSLN